MKELRELREELENAVDAYNALLGKDATTVAELDAADADIKEKARECAAGYTVKAYKEYLADETPMIAAIVAREYESVAVKDEKDDNGNTIGKKIEPKKMPVNIAGLETFYRTTIVGSKKDKTLGADKDWSRFVQKFNLVLCMRMATRLHLSASEVAKTFAISDSAAKMELGKTPMSEGAVQEMLQSVVDKIVFVDDGGKNKIAVSKYDTAFLVEGYSKKNRKALSLAAANNRQLLDLLTDIIHRNLVQCGYELTYRTKKA